MNTLAPTACADFISERSPLRVPPRPATMVRIDDLKEPIYLKPVGDFLGAPPFDLAGYLKQDLKGQVCKGCGSRSVRILFSRFFIAVVFESLQLFSRYKSYIFFKEVAILCIFHRYSIAEFHFFFFLLSSQVVFNLRQIGTVRKELNKDGGRRLLSNEA